MDRLHNEDNNLPALMVKAYHTLMADIPNSNNQIHRTAKAIYTIISVNIRSLFLFS